MKSVLFLGALSLFAIATDVITPEVPPAPGASQPMRFRVESGTYRGMDGSSGTPVTVRIDTATGRTWRLADRQTDKGFVATWVPIREGGQPAEPPAGRAQ